MDTFNNSIQLHVKSLMLECSTSWQEQQEGSSYSTNLLKQFEDKFQLGFSITVILTVQVVLEWDRRGREICLFGNPLARGGKEFPK